MSVSPQSIEAYNQHVNSGAKQSQREQIHEYVYIHGDVTRRYIAKGLGFELGAVSGRVNKLLLDGLLEDAGTIRCSTTGKTVGLVRIPKFKRVKRVTPEKLITDHIFKEFTSMGFTERQAKLVANSALLKYKRNTNHQKAIKDSIAEGKKLYTKEKKK